MTVISLLFFSSLHILLWGAIGAVLAARAEVPRWIGVLASVVFPVVGALALFIAWLHAGRPSAKAAPASWRRGGWIGVAGGALILCAAWLPWASAEMQGRAEDLEVADVGFDSGSFTALILLGSLLGLMVAGCAYAVVRTGRGAWLIASVLPAASAAVIAGTLVLTEGFIDELGDKGDKMANATTVVGLADAEVSTEYSIGLGPYFCLLGSMIVVLWAFVWAVRVPLAGISGEWTGDSPSGAHVGTPGIADGRGTASTAAGGLGADWPRGGLDRASGDGRQGSDDVRNEWDW